MSEPRHAERWMQPVMVAVAIHYIVWGAVAIVFPLEMLAWLGIDPAPQYPQLWQGIGLILAAIGTGFLVASRDPYRHWPIVLVGLIGKTLGPIGMWLGPEIGTPLPAMMKWLVIPNDIIWWIPFLLILRGARRQALLESVSAISKSE